MKRVVFVLVVLAVLGGLIYCIIDCNPTVSKSLHVYVFANKGFNDHDKAILNSYFNEEANEIKILIHSKSNTSGSEFIFRKPEGIVKENGAKELFSKSIDSLLKSIPKYDISINETNSLVEQFANTINTANNSTTGANIILLGAFPDCYNLNDLKKVNILSKIKKIDNKDIEINWCLKTNSNEPEENIYKDLQKLNITLQNNPEIIPNRICVDKELKSVYAVFFDKLNLAQAKEFEDYLRNNYGNNLKLTIWNDGVKNNSVVKFTSENIKIDSILNIFHLLDRAKWTSLQYLVKQAINNLTTITNKTPLFFIGNMPTSEKESQLSPDVWKQFRSNKKIETILYLPRNTKLNETDKFFREGLKSLNIEFKYI